MAVAALSGAEVRAGEIVIRPGTSASKHSEATGSGIILDERDVLAVFMVPRAGSAEVADAVLVLDSEARIKLESLHRGRHMQLSFGYQGNAFEARVGASYWHLLVLGLSKEGKGIARLLELRPTVRLSSFHEVTPMPGRGVSPCKTRELGEHSESDWAEGPLLEGRPHGLWTFANRFGQPIEAVVFDSGCEVRSLRLRK